MRSIVNCFFENIQFYKFNKKEKIHFPDNQFKGESGVSILLYLRGYFLSTTTWSNRFPDKSTSKAAPKPIT